MNPASAIPVIGPAAIPDHTLLRVIGRGSYGEVWLAHNVMGTPRAVKIVRRDAFDSERPYLREFEGIRRCEPISRAHDGLLDILQVGRHVDGSWFYYVMELADPQDGHEGVENYCPMTLAARIAETPRLDAQACLRLAESLAGALAFLHEQGLIHRDVKPSNILYASGVPKLGDIGLVAEAGSSRSFVGTEGFVPLEGPGTERADIYALGKVLYEALTGLDRGCFPRLPSDWTEAPDFRQRVELNEIVLRACEGDASKRYASAREMLADVVLVSSGRSVRRLRWLESRLRLFKAAGAVALVLALLVSVAVGLLRRERHRSSALETARSQQAAAAKELGRANVRLQEAIDTSELDRAEGHFRAGESSAAIALLLHILERDPTHPVAGPRLAAALWHGQFALPHSPPWLVGSKVVHLGLVQEGGALLVATRDGVFTLDAISGERLSVFEPTGTVTQFDGFTASGDNRTLVGWDAAASGVTAVYDVATGRLRGKALVHDGPIHGVAIAAGGSAFVAISQDGKFQVCDVGTALPVGPPIDNGEPVWDASLSPDGLKLAATAGKSVRLWDVQSGQLLQEFPARDEPVRRVRFSPDGRFILVAEADGRMQFVGTADGRPAGASMRHLAEFRSAAFSRDGNRLLVASNDRSARLWSVPDGLALTPPLWHRDAVNFAIFNADETRIVSGGLDILTRVWDVATGRPAAQPLQHFEQPRTAVCLPGTSLLYTGGADGLITCWDLPDSGVSARVIAGEKAEFSPDGRLLARAGAEQPLVDAATFTAVPWLPAFPQAPRLVRFNRDGTQVAFVSDRSVTIWKIGDSSGQRGLELYSDGAIADLAFSPDGRWLAVGTEAGSTLVWNLQDGAAVTAPPRQADPVTLVRFSPGGETLLTGTSSAPQIFRPGHSARLWDMRSATPLGEPIVHRDDVLEAQFSPDGSAVVVAGRDNVAQVCDATTGKRLFRPLTHVRVVSRAAFSPDGRWVATASWDGSARVWNARTGAPVTPALPHDDRVIDCQFSPDGSRLATAARDGTVRVWHGTSGQPLTEPLRLGAAVFQIRWHPGGGEIAVSLETGTIEVIEVPAFTGASPAWLLTIASILSQAELSRDPATAWAMAVRSIEARAGALAAPADSPHGRLARRLFPQ